MNDNGQDVTRLRHWQVKDFPEEKRKAVTTAAAQAGKTVAAWLEPAIDRALADEGRVGEVTQFTPAAVNSRELRELAELARMLTPPDRDSEAMRRARSLVNRRLKAVQANLISSSEAARTE